MGNATSIYNLMRNIGGSFGIATMTTFLARRQQVHQSQLIAHVTPMDIRTQTIVRGLQSWFQLHGTTSAHDAGHKAWGAIYGMVQQQAAMLSFVEAFWLMGLIFMAMLPLLLLLMDLRITFDKLESFLVHVFLLFLFLSFSVVRLLLSMHIIEHPNTHSNDNEQTEEK